MAVDALRREHEEPLDLVARRRRVRARADRSPALSERDALRLRGLEERVGARFVRKLDSDDARARLTGRENGIPERYESLAQARLVLGHSREDRVASGPQRAHARGESRHGGEVRKAGLQPARAVAGLEALALGVGRGARAGPAHERHAELLEAARANVEKAAPHRTQKPLLAAARVEVDAERRDIEP